MFLLDSHLLQRYSTFLIHDNLKELLPLFLSLDSGWIVTEFSVVFPIWIVLFKAEIYEWYCKSWTVHLVVLDDLISCFAENEGLLILVVLLFLLWLERLSFLGLRHLFQFIPLDCESLKHAILRWRDLSLGMLQHWNRFFHNSNI